MMAGFRILPTLAVFLILEITGLNGLTDNDVDLIFPAVIKEGDSVSMHCKFNEQMFPQIYTVQWYKGQREIFRVTPKNEPEMQEFPLSGLTINKAQSTMQKLAIRNAPQYLTGVIKCEVTLLGNFKSVTKTRPIIVIAPADQPPQLEVFPRQTSYQDLPEQLKLICRTGESTPAANITFYVNGRRRDATRTYNSSTLAIGGTSNIPSNSGNATSAAAAERTGVAVTGELTMRLSESNFIDNKLTINCVSQIHNFTWSSNRFVAEVVVTAKPVRLAGVSAATRTWVGSVVHCYGLAAAVLISWCRIRIA